MDEIRTLLEEFWISRDSDREKYYRVKRDVPKFQKFIREQLGWKLIHTEHLIKLEKIPAHAESFMGIQEFTEIQDYCILCAVLMFLEDREEQERFLLSELIDYVETVLKGDLPIDWTSFTQRKSLVRVMQYLEKLQILRVHEGSSEAFGQERGREVLYENTGYSRYFAVSLGRDISAYESWQDFEKAEFEELSEDRGSRRINRVYRQLAACPALYWQSSDDPDAYYLKNQRQWVGKYLGEHLGGRLDIHRNAAFWMLEDSEVFGTVHPRDAMLPEAVLLVCARLQDMVQSGELEQREDGCLEMRKEEFFQLIRNLRDRWNSAWSKEYREMDEEKLLERILQYMKDWMLLRLEDEHVILLPAVGKLKGYYPKDYTGGESK
ncbi:MAG TPA: TIGR02678 family protein [Candidatus Fusicatenibacter intestinigallinarum]|uniref:TIGR02678 family protein n=1 Tax=Candidatus Fusicatenibacter intestinigallinarum TaxID=2838598 RepID=A0A9D2NBK4_9FIRM|nr:TIGR02678 family protein [Candidatus Fusicatenibacter intestinigallinarum]